MYHAYGFVSQNSHGHIIQYLGVLEKGSSGSKKVPVFIILFFLRANASMSVEMDQPSRLISISTLNTSSGIPAVK